MQRCAFGYDAAAAKEGRLVRRTTGAKVLSDEVLVCPSFLAGAAGTASFSVSLNGVDFIADATAQMQYKFYDQPDYHVGLDPTGGPRQGGTEMTLFGAGFHNFDARPDSARCIWGEANVPTLHRKASVPSVLEPGRAVCPSV